MIYHCADCEALAGQLKGWSSLRDFLESSLYICSMTGQDCVGIIEHLEINRETARELFKINGVEAPGSVEAYFDNIELEHLIKGGGAKESKRL